MTIKKKKNNNSNSPWKLFDQSNWKYISILKLHARKTLTKNFLSTYNSNLSIAKKFHFYMYSENSVYWKYSFANSHLDVRPNLILKQKFWIDC